MHEPSDFPQPRRAILLYYGVQINAWRLGPQRGFSPVLTCAKYLLTVMHSTKTADLSPPARDKLGVLGLNHWHAVHQLEPNLNVTP